MDKMEMKGKRQYRKKKEISNAVKIILVFSCWPHKKILATDRVSKLEHLLETRDVVVVDENSLNAPVEERGVVRLLAAQVEHLVPE